MDRADPGTRPPLERTRELRILGGRGRADSDHGDRARSGWAGRTFAERLEFAGIAGIPDTHVVTARVAHPRRGADDQTVGTRQADCGRTYRASFGGAECIRTTTHRETHINAHTNAKPHANCDAIANANANATAKSLPVMHKQGTVVHELLRQQQSPVVHHVLRRQ